MNRFLGIALLAAGIVLIVLGINASESFSSDISRLFNGAPTDKSIWLLVGGILLSGVGLFFSLSRTTTP